MIRSIINGQAKSLDVEDEAPLLWVLRDELGLTGPKFGCGIGACGACTVHMNGQAVRSCITPASAAGGVRITTIEGLSPDRSHPLQKAWIARQTPQCGYCQSGMIMAAAALLARNPSPSESDIRAAITNICRCGTYPRVIQAVLDVAGGTGAGPAKASA